MYIYVYVKSLQEIKIKNQFFFKYLLKQLFTKKMFISLVV